MSAHDKHPTRVSVEVNGYTWRVHGARPVNGGIVILSSWSALSRWTARSPNRSGTRYGRRWREPWSCRSPRSPGYRRT
jgi:hypothetical protein